MYDANLVNFYSRVADYQSSHGKGYGHEAPGTLGRSVTYGLPKKRLRLRLRFRLRESPRPRAMQCRRLHQHTGLPHQGHREKHQQGIG